RGTAGVAGPAADGRVVSRLRARQGRPPVAGETAGALPAERATPARRRPGDHRAPRRTRSTPGPAAARSGFARRLRTARRGERARVGRAPGRRLRRRRNPPRGRQSVKPRSATVRIAAGQGFWGDWLEAPYRQVTGGPVDYLMMDYLAEVTMSILQKQKSRDPSLGYAKDFIPLMERILPIVAERRIKITANAGGVNPRGCAQAVAEVARRLRLSGKLRIGVVTGDDLLGRLDGLLARGHELRNLDTNRRLADVRDRVVSANAYLGAWPIAEAAPDGTFEITKHPGTGGRISVAGVTEQLVYEMGNPAEYITPDCIADFTTIRLEQHGKDRVRVSGVRGRPATDKLKVSIGYFYGYKAVG